MPGEGKHLRPGLAVPPIMLPATDGTSVSLAERVGSTLVAVYPWTGRPGLPNPPDWDDIPGAHGSTPELEGFRDLYQDFQRLRVSMFGLSLQTVDYQQEMTRRLRLPFPILSDAEGRFATALGLPSFATGGANYLKRLTLVLRDGRIEHVFDPVPDPAGHAAAVLRWLRGKAA